MRLAYRALAVCFRLYLFADSLGDWRPLPFLVRPRSLKPFIEWQKLLLLKKDDPLFRLIDLELAGAILFWRVFGKPAQKRR